MSESGGEGDAPQPAPRKVRTRQPTLIGLPVEKPTIDPPKVEPPAPAAAAAVAKKAFPAPAESGVAPKPAFPFRPGGGGLPPRKKPLPPRPRRTIPDPVEPAPGDAEAPVEDLASEPTQAGADPGRTLMDEWAPAEIPEEGEGDPPLPAESTQVSDEPEAIHTDPGLDVPYEGDLVSEETRPAAARPEEAATPSEPPDEPDHPERTTSEDFVPVSTVIVDPASLRQPAPVYTMDLESGAVSMQSAAYDEPLEVPGRRSPLPLIAGGLIAAVVIVGVGVGVGYVVMSSSTDAPSVAPVASVDPAGAVAPPEGAAAPDAPAPPEGAVAAPAVAPEPAPAGTPGEEAEAAEPDDDVAEAAAPAPTAGAPASVEAIEAYELELPRVSRRARRMPQAERRRQANRLRARGLAAYREERWDDAAREFAAALEHNDWDVASIEGMARTRARQGQFPEAVAWAELAVQRNARSAATFRILGDVWRQAGHDDRALAAWRRGLRRHPGDRWLRQRIRELSE